MRPLLNSKFLQFYYLYPSEKIYLNVFEILLFCAEYTTNMFTYLFA